MSIHFWRNCGKIKQTTKVAIKTGVDTTEAVIKAIKLVAKPPKYGIIVVRQARTPRSNQFG